jgi:hypothetical protein
MKTKEDYPIVLKVSHVAEIMGIAPSTAYEHLRREDRLGKLVIEGTGCKRVYRDRFFKHLEGSA